ncbi:WD-40 repeat protein [Reticulomyxa filosa]|uniref:WD-40 repeat protein n=1 Tax=Reticulomyxa filosa TaxID=46433 RepID=X6M4G7_RETFI|nr:WD-40 repeat protein [Reticulomyxa filosa]|eukprot:ETO07915.1 WD-40 repeat protein [Reticulomyxa filosa]
MILRVIEFNRRYVNFQLTNFSLECQCKGKRLISQERIQKRNVDTTIIEEKDKIQAIVQHWVRILDIRFGWIQDFDRLVVKYATTFFIFELFCSPSKLFKTFTGHTDIIWSIDYSTLNNGQFIYSGSGDKTVRVWNVETSQQIQPFNGHSNHVYYKTIRFWDIKHNQELQVLNEHTGGVNCIEFSPFNSGRYLCSGSRDNTICLWDIGTYKLLHVFNGHEDTVWCVDISPLQSNNKSDNNIGVIGGNGYTICSGSYDNTIRIWDIETTKQLTVFKGHRYAVRSIKYGANEIGNIGCANTILSGSNDCSVRLWDIRSGQQIQMFNGHKNWVSAVEYSPFVVNNNEIGGNSNVICSGSFDNTIRFWDIRSNKKELYVITRGDDDGIVCLKFLQLHENNNDSGCDINLCYGSGNGPIHIWG